MASDSVVPPDFFVRHAKSRKHLIKKRNLIDAYEQSFQIKLTECFSPILGHFKCNNFRQSKNTVSRILSFYRGAVLKVDKLLINNENIKIVFLFDFQSGCVFFFRPFRNFKNSIKILLIFDNYIFNFYKSSSTHQLFSNRQVVPSY